MKCVGKGSSFPMLRFHVLILARLALSSLFVLASAPGQIASAAQRPVISAGVPAKLTISGAYASPKSRSRAARKQTQFIILHTTEGSVRGALQKLSKNGECHYVINTDGAIYRIIDRKKVAFHCGRSMWNGKTDLDLVSIGIEMVGYHNKPLSAKQYESLKLLIADLKRIYKVPDNRILTHSMVAYGAPNRWQRKSHRGRKRCAMLLADSETREKIGIKSKPAFDPDIKARRLVDADPELTRLLYAQVKRKTAETPANNTPQESNVIGPGRSAWDIARDLYNAQTTIYTFPDGTKKTGREITKWKAIPAGTKVTMDEEQAENPADKLLIIGDDSTAVDLAGDEVRAPTTFYFQPGEKQYSCGEDMTQEETSALPAGTRVLVGYSVGGPISARKPAFSICGVRWNRPETYYFTTKGVLIAGDTLNEKNLPTKAMIFYRK